jgi:hypothetical protein
MHGATTSTSRGIELGRTGGSELVLRSGRNDEGVVVLQSSPLREHIDGDLDSEDCEDAGDSIRGSGCDWCSCCCCCCRDSSGSFDCSAESDSSSSVDGSSTSSRQPRHALVIQASCATESTKRVLPQHTHEAGVFAGTLGSWLGRVGHSIRDTESRYFQYLHSRMNPSSDALTIFSGSARHQSTLFTSLRWHDI